MPHPDDTTATIERDLRAVDAALAGDEATHHDPLVRELQELALALRADAPDPDPTFADELRAGVEAGFPPKPGSPRARLSAAGAALRRAVPRRPSWDGLRAVAGVIAPLLLIVAIVSAATLLPGSSDQGGDDDGGAVEAAGGDDAGSAAPNAAVRPQQRARRADGDDAGGGNVAPAEPPVLPGTAFAPGPRERKVERSISMTLAAPDEEIPAVADGVAEVTNRHGGFVLRSNLNSDDEGSTGFFELRIPSGRLREALADLAGLATVRSQSQSGQDVTRRHVTAKDRLQSARAERRSLLRRLAEATTDEEVESIRRRLDLVAGEINGLRGQLRNLRLRTDYAIVTVELAGEDSDPGAGGAGGSFDDALGDAGDLLVGLAGALIRVLALALPLGLIALAAWLVGRTFRRRRRESVLA
jgi:uncharacterized protein DUF4349